MPRRSVNALSIAPPPHHPVATAAPPAELTAEEVVIWRRITASRPPEFFDDGALHLLAALVRHVSAFEALSAQMVGLDFADEDELTRFSKLSGLRERESKLIRGLTASLRLGPQSRYTPERAAAAVQRSVPRGVEALIAARRARDVGLDA